MSADDSMKLPVRTGRKEAQRIPLVDFALAGYTLTPIEDLASTFADMRKAALEVNAIGPSSVMRGFQPCRPADFIAQDDKNSAPIRNGVDDDNASERTGILFPFEVRLHPENGRSVYFTAAVPKGTLLWRGSFDSSAVFTSRDQFEEFLAKLTIEQACEAIQWIFPDRIKRQQHSIDRLEALEEARVNRKTLDGNGALEGDVVAMVLVLDEGSLFDHTDSDPLGSTEDWCSRALRDIQAGEALTESYNSMPDDSDWFCSFVDDLVVARQSCKSAAEVIKLVLSQRVRKRKLDNLA